MRRLVGVAAGSAVLLLAACGPFGGGGGPSQAAPDGAGPSPSAAAPAPLHLLLSDGTDTVTIDGKPVRFPTTVTDAVWSPDGSRVAFIGGAGNVASARPDGSDLVVYTTTDSSVTRSHPTWAGTSIIFTETNADGTSGLMTALANNRYPGTADLDYDTGVGTSYVDGYPSSRVVDLGSNYLVFQHDEPSGPEVWIIDDNGRGQVVQKIVDGSEPTLNADGSMLAFVGTNGQIEIQPLAKDAPTGPAVQVSFGVDAPHKPVFAPDATHVIFETGTDVEEVSTAVAADATSNPTQQLAATPAIPSVAAKLDTVVRIAGDDPVAESVAASRASFMTGLGFPGRMSYPGLPSVRLVSIDDVDDPAAYVVDTPLLFTDPDTLDPRVLDELHRLFGTDFTHREIDVVGISAAVSQQLASMGAQVVAGSVGPGYSEGISATPYELVIVDNPVGGQINAGREIAASIAITSDSSDGTRGPAVISLLEWDTSQPLNDAMTTWLSHSATSINRLVFVGPVPDAFVAQIAGLVSGPLGYDSVTNPDPVALF